MASEPSESADRATRFFGNPAVGIAGSIASVVGLGLAIYFYAASRTSRDLVYFVHPAKAAVVRAQQSSRLHIELDGAAVTRDVTAAQIALWNEGEEPIRSANMLSKLVVSTGPNNPIIEADVRKVSREVVGLRLDKTGTSGGALRVDWTILERNDGAILQLIYFGDAQTPVTASAIVEKQGAIRSLEYGAKIQTADEQYRRRGEIGKPLGYIYLAMSLFSGAFGAFRMRRRRLAGFPAEWALTLMYIFMPVAMAAISLYLIFWVAVKPGPPFEF